MRKIFAILAAALPAVAFAQSAIDAQLISQPDFKGTARYMSMGGAFTALGGDLSAMSQNPAGIGVYRRSEVGVTLDINMQKTKTDPAFGPTFPANCSQTKAYCNNFGYVGSTNLSGAMKTFNWGVSYSRIASFDRVYRGYVPQTSTSLSNYVAYFTNGQNPNPNDMVFGSDGYDPYLDSDIDWLSILSYNSFMINDINGTYSGLYQMNQTQGDAMFNVCDQGGVDEYNISFGGNVENVVYWGVSVGITDLKYTRTTYYSESMADALINSQGANNFTDGNAGFDLYNRKYINGSGWNIKAGLIFKPINEFRIGLAVHTPTWYRFNQGYDGSVDYSYYDPNLPDGLDNPLADSFDTDYAMFDWHFKSPWKLMVGVAGVIGNNFIISADYQFDGYNSMSISTPYYYGLDYGYSSIFEPDDALNQDIKDYFKASNTLRLGLEYRVTPQFSVRAGYNIQSTNVKDQASTGSIQVVTSGTDPSYAFDKTTQYVSFGLGYKYQAWYIDAAYVYKNRESTYHGYTDFGGNLAPTSRILDHNSSIVLSTGFKF